MTVFQVWIYRMSEILYHIIQKYLLIDSVLFHYRHKVMTILQADPMSEIKLYVIHKILFN